MNLVNFRGRLLGLILKAHEPDTWFIVVEDLGHTFRAVMVVKVGEASAHLSTSYDFSIGDEFVGVVSLEEFKKMNFDGWTKFQTTYRKVADHMEAQNG